MALAARPLSTYSFLLQAKTPLRHLRMLATQTRPVLYSPTCSSVTSRRALYVLLLIEPTHRRR